MSLADALVPESLRARYEPRRLLGKGGFGRVVLCRDLRMDRDVALKLLELSLDSEEAGARFRREARVTAELRHPHIVPVFDHGVSEEGVPFIAYARLPGPDLETAAANSDRDPEWIRRWALGVARALVAAHEAGLIHRDVKPANVLLDQDDEAVLADFGMARALQPSEETLHTAEGMLLGTPAFLSPEQFLQGLPPSPAADQFAWGATVFCLLTGSVPYGDPELRTILRLLREDWYGAAREKLADFDPGLVRVVLRTLNPDPGGRFPDMAAVVSALEGDAPSVQAAPTQVLPGEALEGTGAEPAGRARPTWLLLPLLLLGLAGYGWLSAERAEVPPPPRSVEPSSPAPRSNPARLERCLEEIRRAMKGVLGEGHPGLEHLDGDRRRKDTLKVVRAPEVLAAIRSAIEALADEFRGPDRDSWTPTPAGFQALGRVSLRVRQLRPIVLGDTGTFTLTLEDEHENTIEVLKRAWEDWDTLGLHIDDELIRPALEGQGPPIRLRCHLAALSAVAWSPSYAELLSGLLERPGELPGDPSLPGALSLAVDPLTENAWRRRVDCRRIRPLLAGLPAMLDRLLGPEFKNDRPIYIGLRFTSAVLEGLEDCDPDEEAIRIAGGLGRLIEHLHRNRPRSLIKFERDRIRDIRRSIRRGALRRHPQLQGLEPRIFEVLAGLEG